MKKQAVLKISGILLALALVATAVCFALNRGHDSGSSSSAGSISKKVYEGHPSLAWTSLLERCQRADYIIAGTVISRGETTLHEGAQPPPYTPIYFQAQKIIKGNPPDGIVEFHEDGGELDNAIYIVDGSNNFQPGDRAIIFVNEYKGPFSAYCQHVLNGDPILLPPDQFEGLGIPEEYSKDEYGNVLFTEDEFVDYVTGIVKSLE